MLNRKEPGRVIDGVGLGQEAYASGEVPHAGAVSLVDGQTQLAANLEHMPFVAAGGLADDQERTKAGLG